MCCARRENRPNDLLPDDIDALRAVALNAIAERDAAIAERDRLVDKTPVPVLDPGRGQTKTGYFWAIARYDQSWGGTDPPAVVYTYAPGRGGEHFEKLLANYRGVVQCDGYAPYKKLPADRITVAFNWSQDSTSLLELKRHRDNGRYTDRGFRREDTPDAWRPPPPAYNGNNWNWGR